MNLRRRNNQVANHFNPIHTNLLFAALLLLIILLTYLIPSRGLGFTGDDWHLIWLNYRLNNLSNLFYPARLGMQWMYSWVMPLLAPQPWMWFLLVFFLTWCTGLVLFHLLKRLFPGHPAEAGVFSILFCLYPGYFTSFMPITRLHGFVEPLALCLSFYLMLSWLQSKEHGWFFLLAALLTSSINLVFTEYYLFLELLRPLILWKMLPADSPTRVRWRALLERWAPFLLLFLAVVIYRVIHLSTSWYMEGFILDDFVSQPFQAFASLLDRIGNDFSLVILQPLLYSFRQLPVITRANQHQAITIILVALMTAIFLWFTPHKKIRLNVPTLILLALLTFLFAGIPIWLVNLQIIFGFEMKNRFAMAQAFSFTIFISTIVYQFFSRSKLTKIIVLSLLAGLFAGVQVQGADLYQQEWEQEKVLFWNLAWRMPSIQPGTVLMMNNPQYLLSGENSVSAALNWNYVREPHPTHSDYFIYFNEHRFLADFPDFPADQWVTSVHTIGPVRLNPSQVIVFSNRPPACPRVLNPETDIYDPTITDFTHDYIKYSNPLLIQSTNLWNTAWLDPHIFGEEPERDWCFYFQKADLARQLGDWKSFAEISAEVEDPRTHFRSPFELVPFIEGFAHLEDWDRSMVLTAEILRISSTYNLVTCALWQRINHNTTASEGKTRALAWMTSRTGCPF